MEQKGEVKWWVKAILFIAGLYNIVSGTLAVIFPHLLFDTAGLEYINYIFIWQSLGVVEIALGVGFLFAFANPVRHWTPVLIGLIFKTITPLIFLVNASQLHSLWSLNNFIIIDNLVWVLPFILVLYQVYLRSFSSDDLIIEMFSDEDQYSLDMFDTNEEINLEELTYQSPVMLVFLRHFGCTFCREALHDIASNRHSIEAKGAQIVLVHMLEDEDEARSELSKYGLQDLQFVSDPEQILYKKFKLRKGTITQLLGPKVWFRGVIAGIFKGYGLGKEMGDMSQMPGIFLLHKGEIQEQYIHHSAADRPNYLKIADCNSCEAA